MPPRSSNLHEKDINETIFEKKLITLEFCENLTIRFLAFERIYLRRVKRIERVRYYLGDCRCRLGFGSHRHPRQVCSGGASQDVVSCGSAMPPFRFYVSSRSGANLFLQRLGIGKRDSADSAHLCGRIAIDLEAESRTRCHRHVCV